MITAEGILQIRPTNTKIPYILSRIKYVYFVYFLFPIEFISNVLLFNFAKSPRWEGDNSVRGQFNVQAGKEEDDAVQRSQEIQKQDRDPIRRDHDLWRP